MIAQNKKVALLVSNYFEQTEFTEPLSALKSIGVQVDVVSSVNEPLQGLHHVDKGDTFMVDRHLDDVDPSEYDALVLPGGTINADHLRMNEKAREWVRTFLQSDKLVAAICHAPWLLVSAGVVQGRKLTSYHTIQDDIKNAGGEWVDQEVVIDKNLITSCGPDDLPAFNDAIIDFLGTEHAAF